MNSLVPPEARFLALGSKGVGKSGTTSELIENAPDKGMF